MEHPKFDPLFNCTLELLEFVKFVNVTADFNHTSVPEFLRDVFGGKNFFLEPESKLKAMEFISACILPPRPYDLIWWQKLVWTAVFAIMLLIATGGNLIVMWIVLDPSPRRSHKRSGQLKGDQSKTVTPVKITCVPKNPNPFGQKLLSDDKSRCSDCALLPLRPLRSRPNSHKAKRWSADRSAPLPTIASRQDKVNHGHGNLHWGYKGVAVPQYDVEVPP